MTASLDRDEDRMPDLVLDVVGEVALAGGVLDQDHLAGLDKAALAVARGDLHPGVEVDDVLPARPVARPGPPCTVPSGRVASFSWRTRLASRRSSAASRSSSLSQTKKARVTPTDIGSKRLPCASTPAR